VIANVLIIYKDKKRAWIPRFEVDKLSLYLKFIPRYDKIKLIQLYHHEIENLESISVSYENIDEEFVDLKDGEYKNYKKSLRKPEFEIYDKFIKEIKDLFLEKYDLYLRTIKMELVKIKDFYYLVDLDDIIFHKYNNRNPKMKFEKMITSFKEKHADRNLKLTKDTPNVIEINDLAETMKRVFDDKIIEKCGVPKYLKTPEKDPRADEAFKVLRENCPHKFSELLSDDVEKKTFLKYCSNKIIKYS